MLLLCSCPGFKFTDVNLMSKHDHMIFPPVETDCFRQVLLLNRDDNVVTKNWGSGVNARGKVHSISNCE